MKTRPETNDRLFIGLFPTGVVYCDRSIEEHGDFQKVAYLNYRTLVLEVYKPGSPLITAIDEDAARMRLRKGEQFRIAGNMTVQLGSDAP